jgi:hypothetical protein
MPQSIEHQIADCSPITRASEPVRSAPIAKRRRRRTMLPDNIFQNFDGSPYPCTYFHQRP